MNFKIEDDIDFNTELMKAICDDSDDEDNNKCLISNMPLNKIHITLSCNHKFNYESIYNDVIKQKHPTTTIMEITRLKVNQFKCPYCRTVQSKLLPYLPNQGVNIRRIRGINSPDKHVMKLYKCPHKFKSGKRKGETCNLPVNEQYCKAHGKLACNMQQSSETSISTCNAIIKTGPRKGQQCGCGKIFFLKHPTTEHPDEIRYCKRHYKQLSNLPMME